MAARTLASHGLLPRIRVGFEKVRRWRSRGASLGPRQLVQTMRLQRRVVGGGRVYVSGRAAVRLRQGARIEIPSGGRLMLGSGGSNDVMDADRLRAAVYLGSGARLVVDGRARLGYGTKIRVAPGATLTIGDGVYVNARCLIIASHDVTIGAGSLLGWDCQVQDDSFHQIRRTDGSWPPVKRPTVIGEHCWLGSGVLVLAGVTIGSGSVAGARSVVSRDVPERTLVAGAPAAPVRGEIEWRV